ncbi:hypothetical protein [Rhizobium rhizogenes]|uniref:hypothetical protein n=1 Tax=Rhizobium rhizogenes TaxID=359 RepID=UPI001F1C9FF7|nr:hypothetical protein [Rhizobium rhizogenes]
MTNSINRSVAWFPKASSEAHLGSLISGASMSATRTFVPSIHSVSPSMTQAFRWPPVHFPNIVAVIFGAASVFDAALAMRAVVLMMPNTMAGIVRLR